MNEYLLVKWLHVLSSTVLFGTGLGSTLLGIPAFIALVIVFWLMIAKPA